MSDWLVLALAIIFGFLFIFTLASVLDHRRKVMAFKGHKTLSGKGQADK